ncbi:hypothetical protein DCAR_0100244 [Daucus carota subsp. sativus]|uniref:Uncharacterized protein n=1 Tax=Daucus carota subsp. sativus TaxID=79200 RepID=A0AAF0W1N8_DAUCS|nr:hypothetical protein DCAR_0100244 [Daucus carota subsp. sativus]
MREGSRTGFRPNRARSQRVQSNNKRKIEQGKGERSCPLFSGSGNPPPKNSRFTLAHEVAGLAR